MQNVKGARTARKSAQEVIHTFNAVVRTFSEPTRTKDGRQLLTALQTLGVKRQDPKRLKVGDIFAAWPECMKVGNDIAMYKSVPVKVVLAGKERKAVNVDGQTAARVYVLTPIVSATSVNAPTNHIEVTADIILRGLEQCVTAERWAKLAQKSVDAAKEVKAVFTSYKDKEKGTEKQFDYLPVSFDNGLFVADLVKYQIIEPIVAQYNMGGMTEGEFNSQIEIILNEK